MQVLWGIVYLLCTALGLAGLVLGLAGVRDVRRAVRSRDWPTVPGRVISSELIRHERPAPQGMESTRAWYEARVHYEYAPDRVRIGSSSVRLEPSERRSEPDARAALERYRPGTEVQVAYNPGEPTESLLEPGLHPTSFARAAMGGGLLVVAVVLPLAVHWFLARG